MYNSSASAINLAGYKIYDSGGQSGSKPKKEFPAGTVIPSHGFVVIVTDDTTSSGFGLSSSGETVWLEHAAGLIVDSVSFPALAVDQSYGRLPDGGAWQILSTITRGFANSTTTGVQDESAIVKEFRLGQNYPNPFNPATTITYQLTANDNVKLVVYNLLGAEIRTLVNEQQSPGVHSITWDGTNQLGQSVTSGMYFYRLQSGGRFEVRRMTLLK